MAIATILLALVLLLLTGMPIFAGLGIAATGLMLLAGHNVASFAEVVFGKLNTYLLVSIPLFSLMAHFLIRARVVDDLFAAVQTAVRHMPGGLGVATILSCTLFAAISGSSVATALTIGSTAIPQMAKFGYSRSAAFGAVAAGGTLGILIPPSGPMILYAVIADASIGALFIAGIVPGLMMALLFSIWCMVSMRGVAREGRADSAELGQALRRAFWPLAMPPVVLGGLYFGAFTATEAAAVGALLAWIIGAFLYRSLSLRDTLLCAYDTVRTTSMLFLILAGAAMFGHVVTLLRLPMTLMEAVTALDVGATGFVLIVMAVIFVLGMFLETVSIILVTTPLILPAMVHYGIDPIWYGVLLMINLELALITPPVGMNLFVIKAIVDAPIAEVISGSLPYVVLMLAGLALVFVFPSIATWLPTLAGFD